MPDAKSLAKSSILKARKELAQGNLAGAVYWYRRAAEQQASFGPNEDSPERLAADIRQMGGKLEEGAIAGAMQQARGQATGNLIPLPPTNQVTQIPSASGHRYPGLGAASAMPGLENQNHPAAGDMSAPSQTQANDMILSARRALAMGDVRRAMGLVQQAKSLGVQYGPMDDTPEKVEAAASMYADLMVRRNEQGGTEAFRRQYARLLMEQSDALLRWRELDEAERLATEAARQRVNYSPFDQRPETMLEQIAAARRQGRPGVSSATSGGAVPAYGAMEGATPMRQNPSAVIPASGQYGAPNGGPSDYDRRASSAVYDPSNDPTQNVLATSQQPLTSQGSAAAPGGAMYLYQQGEAALKAHDTPTAIQYFRQAYARVNELDAFTARRLQDYMQQFAAVPLAPRGVAPGAGLDDAAAKQSVLTRQVGLRSGPPGNKRLEDPGNRSQGSVGHHGTGKGKDRRGRPGTLGPRPIAASSRSRPGRSAQVHPGEPSAVGPGRAERQDPPASRS